MKKETVLNLVLLLLLGTATFSLTLNLTRRSTDLEERTEWFWGYTAFLDRELHLIQAGDWGMGKTLRENDVVVWVRADRSSVRVGDLLLYREPDTGTLLVHRVVGVENRFFRTKGDGLPSPDNYLVENFEGLVIGVIYSR